MNNLSGTSTKTNVLKYKLHLSDYPTDELLDDYHRFIGALTNNGPSPVVTFKKHPRQRKLYGSTCVEGRIEDEWLIVYLLFKLSEHDHDLVIQVFDSDGDILLIEAAEHLPRWLESRQSKNRTFIHAGNVHIVPKHIDLNKLHKDHADLSLAQVAAQFVRDINKANKSNTPGTSPETTLASSQIQKAIKKHLVGMPDKNAWLSRMYQQLDDIISDKECLDLKNKFSPAELTLRSIMKMSDDELVISPINSPASSNSSAVSSPPLSPNASSSSCLSEQQND